MSLLSGMLAVALVSFLAVLSPGPDFFIVMKNSLSHSRRAGFLTSFGVCAALIVHLTYTLVGIGVLLTEGSIPYFILKYGGATYLFYLGFKGWLVSFKKQKAYDLQFAGTAGMLSSGTAFRQGFLTNLLNPKCALFFLSLFSQFISPETPTAVKVSYALVNWTVSLGWFLLLSYLVSSEKMLARMRNYQTLVDRVMGALLIALSLKILFL